MTRARLTRLRTLATRLHDAISEEGAAYRQAREQQADGAADAAIVRLVARFHVLAIGLDQEISAAGREDDAQARWVAAALSRAPQA